MVANRTRPAPRLGLQHHNIHCAPPTRAPRGTACESSGAARPGAHAPAPAPSATTPPAPHTGLPAMRTWRNGARNSTSSCTRSARCSHRAQPAAARLRACPGGRRRSSSSTSRRSSRRHSPLRSLRVSRAARVSLSISTLRSRRWAKRRTATGAPGPSRRRAATSPIRARRAAREAREASSRATSKQLSWSSLRLSGRTSSRAPRAPSRPRSPRTRPAPARGATRRARAEPR